MTMKKMDEDKDGKVSFEDFEVVSCNLHVFSQTNLFLNMQGDCKE